MTISNRYRSDLEGLVADQLEKQRVKFVFEPSRIEYMVPKMRLIHLFGMIMSIGLHISQGLIKLLNPIRDRHYQMLNVIKEVGILG